MEPLISIIVPVYNVEKYLERCILSIINQSYSNIEIIIVNDGSTDGSEDIINKYKKEDSRIKSIYQENGGLSSARNTGIDCCNGEYIMFVDSDDYIHANMTKTLYTNMIENDADISVCDFYWDYDDKIIQETNTNECHFYTGDEVIFQLRDNNLITVVAWNKLYKKELWDDLRYPNGRIHEDEYVIHKLLEKCKGIVYTNDKLYYYIKRGESISST